jgi:hypothetical protein
LIDSKSKEYNESNFASEKSKFEIKINEKSYWINLLSKKQENKETQSFHDISNEIPNILKYQWSWLDDLKQKSPVSLIHSERIEKAFTNGEKLIQIKMKRHNNDEDEIYEYIFERDKAEIEKYIERVETRFRDKNLYKNLSACGIQRNTRTNFPRFIFRDPITTKATVEYPSEGDDCSEQNLIKIFLSGEKENVDKAENLIRCLINDAYVEETVPLIEITETEINKLQEQNNVIIKYNGNDGLIIKALPDAINKIKTRFLELSFQNISSQKIQNPNEWSKMESDNCELFTINKNSEEFKKIKTEISKSIENPLIEKIERIQNPWLWKSYQTKAKFLKEKGRFF